MKKIEILLVMMMATVTVFASQPVKKTSKKAASTTEVTQKVDSVSIMMESAKKGNTVAQNIVGSWYYSGKDSIKQDYQEALKWWALAAKQDNAKAIGNMAMCYQYGHGVKQDSLMAVNLYEQAIKKGNDQLLPLHEKQVEKTGSLFSALLLVDCYQKGIGVKKDLTKAAAYQEKAAAKGHVESQYETALYYQKIGQAAQAAEWYKKAARQQHPLSIYHYGLMTFNGTGVKQNREDGLKLLKMASDKGVSLADYQLGRIYYNGDGVQKDAKTAVPYLCKAAKENIDARWLLANCYLKGEGVAQDYYLAVQWLSDSYVTHKKGLNDLLAADNNGAFTAYLTGLKQYYVDKNIVEAIKSFEQVDKAKNPEGKTMLGVCYASKENAKRNEKKGVKTLTQAIETSAVANYYLAQMYATGTGVDKDDAKALELLKKAADKGIAYAQCQLGDKYFEGNGVTKDLTKAALLYLDAEAQNRLSPSSAKNLVKCYEQKLNVLPDLQNAQKRIEKLNQLKVNNNLSALLKQLEE